uniref:Ycf39 n=1 Tax=Cyanidium sp. THAL103 TaxID=3027999 RepID=A0A9Y1MYB9_9RHOD|nr:Ycf39 [Cyanidium sp. THAL103]
MQILIIGGTGTLGRQIVKQALYDGYEVKCLVRNFQKANFLKDWGAILIYGDLNIKETLPNAFKNVSILIDASTAKLTDISASSFDIDYLAKVNLFKCAKVSLVKKIIIYSIVNAEKYAGNPLMKLKIKLETELSQSSLNFTVFKLAGFFQGIVLDYALPILNDQEIYVIENYPALPYIDSRDVAKLTLKSLNTISSNKRVLSLLGPRSWSPKEIIDLCENLSGKKAKIRQIPKYFLRSFKYILGFLQSFEYVIPKLIFIEISDSRIDLDSNLDNFFNKIKCNYRTLMPLEKYLKDYFLSILNNLREIRKTQNINYLEKNDFI